MRNRSRYYRHANKVLCNSCAAKRQTLIVANYAPARVRVRHVAQNGNTFLVAPLTMIVPGVLAGSQGALLYPSDEVQRSAAAWNNVPLTLGHPADRDGSPVQASKRPDLFLGVVKNARMSNGRLVADGWFSIERTRRVAPDVLRVLEAGQAIELSTGLFTTNEPKQGQHNGRAYDYVARDYRPDHLAILPNQTGACSLRDGCGVLVNTDTENTMSPLEQQMEAALRRRHRQPVVNHADDLTENEADLAFPLPVWNWEEIAIENAEPQSQRRRGFLKGKDAPAGEEVGSLPIHYADEDEDDQLTGNCGEYDDDELTDNALDDEDFNAEFVIPLSTNCDQPDQGRPSPQKYNAPGRGMTSRQARDETLRRLGANDTDEPNTGFVPINPADEYAGPRHSKKVAKGRPRPV